jgi:hypothetical protein
MHLSGQAREKLHSLGHSTLFAAIPSSDKPIVKLFFVIAITAALAAGESHPSWWTYAAPEATTLVGIQWNNLRHSPFAAAIEAELSGSGALGFPDLDCLKQAREIVISSPALLAAEAGSFPAATVKDQAQRQGLRRLVYRGVTLWLPEQADKLGVAQISEQLVLVGARKTLQAAVDRSLLETGRQYSPLLPRAARFSQTGDLWVVAVALPDPLADLFVPLDIDATEFLGQVSVRDGLSVEASFNAVSDAAAAEFARGLRARALSLSAVVRGVEASVDQSRVTLALQVSSEDLAAALHPAASPVQIAAVQVPATAVTAPRMALPQTVAATLAPTPSAEETSLPPPQPPAPVKFEVTHVEEGQPQIIRIFGLDEGTREIVLPP